MMCHAPAAQAVSLQPVHPPPLMPSSLQLLGIYAATLVCHGLLNTFANSILGFLNGEQRLWQK